MKTWILATAALIAAPVAAQTAAAEQAPTVTQSADDATQPRARNKMRQAPRQHMRNKHRTQAQAPMLRNMSPEGRRSLMAAMRTTPEDRAAVGAARDKVNSLIGADKLDSKALAKAMTDERRAVDAQHASKQQRMLAAIEKMSVEDRKALATDTKAARDKMQARMEAWRNRTSKTGTEQTQ